MDKLLFLFAVMAFLFGNKVPDALAEILNFDPIYKKYGEKYGVDWKLIKAIAQVESNENPQAVNPSDPSYGLMQILYPTSLPAVENWPPDSSSELMAPDYNVSIGSQILAWNLNAFGFPKGIAVYNSWSARNDPDNGPFQNQDYVNKVLAKYDALGGAA
jgi:soluble lytic murein transglycosylase-like protein